MANPNNEEAMDGSEALSEEPEALSEEPEVLSEEPEAATEEDNLDDLTELTGLLADQKKKAKAEAEERPDEEVQKAETKIANAPADKEIQEAAAAVAAAKLAAEKAAAAEAKEAEAERAKAGEAEEKGLPEDHPEMGELRDRIDERKKYYARRKRRFRARFYVISWTVILLVAAFLFSISGIFTVDSIEVTGNSRFTAEEIINMGHAVPGKNIIYDLDDATITEYLKGNPYIKNATVSRKLPSTMVIKVTERSERMAFKYDDDYLVMDENGMLLRKSRTEPKVTIIEGMVVNKIKLGEKIGATDSDKLKQAIEINKMADKSDLYFVRVDVSEVKIVKAYVYNTLVVKNDYDTLMENMENGRLHDVIEDLFKRGIKRGTVTFDGDISSFTPTI